jgi:hypothetical protein
MRLAAARVPHLTIQPCAKVRAFLIKYQDRVLYGTDTDIIQRSDVKPSITDWDKQLAEDWRYFYTADTFNYDGHMVKGLRLPPPVLRKLYHDNAVHWIPGLAAEGVTSENYRQSYVARIQPDTIRLLRVSEASRG